MVTKSGRPHYHDQDDVDNNNNGIIIYTHTRNVARLPYINSQTGRTNGEQRQDERTRVTKSKLSKNISIQCIRITTRLWAQRIQTGKT